MQPYPSSLNDDDILDAELHWNEIHLILRDGRRLVLPRSPRHMELYWRVKIRNRRRAFGL